MNKNTMKDTSITPKKLIPLKYPVTTDFQKWKLMFSPSQHHAQGISDIDFSPLKGIFGPHVLLTAGKDGQIIVWDVNEKRQVRIFDHPAEILAARFSADGKFIFAACDDQRLYIWDVESGETAHISDKFKYPIVSLAVSLSGEQIALGCQARGYGGKWECLIYDGTGQNLIKKLPNVYGYIPTLDYSPDGRWLAQGTWGAYIIWDAFNKFKPQQFNAYGGTGSSVDCIRFSPDGNRLATSYPTEPIKIWDRNTGELIRSFAKYERTQNCVAVSPVASLLALSNANKIGNIEVVFLDTETGAQLQKLSLKSRDMVEVMEFSADGKFLAVGTFLSEPVLRIFSQD